MTPLQHQRLMHRLLDAMVVVLVVASLWLVLG